MTTKSPMQLGRAATLLDNAVNVACDTFSPKDWTLIIRALDGESIPSSVELLNVAARAYDAAPSWVRHQRRLIANERCWHLVGGH